MRLKFGMTKTEKTVHTCIIITEVNVITRRLLGALADSVQEVMDLELGQIEPAPRIGMQLKTEFIKGMGKQNERLLSCLISIRYFPQKTLLECRTLKLKQRKICAASKIWTL